MCMHTDDVVNDANFRMYVSFIRPRMEKSHSERHELVDCPLFAIAR